MNKVSVIVPFINEVALLKACAHNIFDIQNNIDTQQLQIAVEWIFVDGGSCDGGKEYIEKLGYEVVESPLGRAEQMNRGAQAASGDWLVFLHIDTQLSLNYFHEFTLLNYGIDWGFSPIKLDAKQKVFRVIESAINWRSKIFKYVTGDQTLFVRKDVFLKGFSYKEIPLMEDVELSKRLFKIAKPHITPTHVLCSARKWLNHGIIKTTLKMWCIQLGFRFNVAPEKLNNWYYGNSLSKKSSAPSQQIRVKPKTVIVAQFAKAPIINLVKTRLSSVLSPPQRVELHKRMVVRVLKNAMAELPEKPSSNEGTGQESRFDGSSARFHQLWVTTSHAFFDQLKAKVRTSIKFQKGKTLGDRLTDCAKRSLGVADAVVLIGSDCVDIDAKVFDQVFDKLNHNDAVLIPAADGGFVLLALRNWKQGLFFDIQWGQSSVRKQLVENINQHGMTLAMLTTMHDIDRPEDLSRLPESIRSRLS